MCVDLGKVAKVVVRTLQYFGVANAYAGHAAYVSRLYTGNRIYRV